MEAGVGTWRTGACQSGLVARTAGAGEERGISFDRTTRFQIVSTADQSIFFLVSMIAGDCQTDARVAASFLDWPLVLMFFNRL